MKTKVIFLISILVFLVILVTSCTKDPIDPVDGPDPIDPTPTIYVKPTVYLDVTPSLDTIPYGDEVTISWDVHYARKTMLNDSLVELRGSKIDRLFESTVYEIYAVNGDSMNTIKKQIKVGDWKTSNFGLLTYEKPWMLKSREIHQDGKIVWESLLNEEQKTDSLFFYKKGIFLGKTYDYSDSNVGTYEFKHKNGEVFGNGTWSLSVSEDGTIRMPSWFADIELSEDKLVIKTNTANGQDLYMYNGKPAISREEYYRPK